MDPAQVLPVLFENGFTILFLLLVAGFAVHALILIYHWLTFGTSRSYAFIALGVYLCVAALIIIGMAVTLMLM